MYLAVHDRHDTYTVCVMPVSRKQLGQKYAAVPKLPFSFCNVFFNALRIFSHGLCSVTYTHVGRDDINHGATEKEFNNEV